MARASDTNQAVVGPPEHWVEVLTRFATDLGFGTFVLVAEPDGATLTSFIEDVAPQVRERGLPRTDLGPARGGQKPLRPDQPLPAQPEHPAGRGLVARDSVRDVRLLEPRDL
jgi:hypothetical protein